MKFRAVTLVSALLLFCLGSYAIAQNSQSPNSNDQASTTTPTSSAGSASNPASPTPTASDQTNSTTPATDQTTANTPAATDQTKDTGKHDGGKDDVDAIGNRKVGGRGFGDWYSLNTEIAMGKQYSQQVESSVKLIQDPVVTEYVNRIGQNLVRNSDAKVPFTIKVIDSDEVNAFALPGGFFYVNSGLILAADNESELAGVMAHEIAHVCARHAMRQLTRAQMANFASIPLIMIGGGVGYAAYELSGLAVPMAFMKFSRDFEAEADYLGVQYMYKTGYDPQSFVAFFEKLQAKEKKKPGSFAKAFASHPQTPDRIDKSQEEIATILPAKETYIVDTSEFNDVKTRLARIENRRKIIDNKDNSKPSLRRTSTGDDKSQTDNGDGRPTLNRRDDHQ